MSSTWVDGQAQENSSSGLGQQVFVSGPETVGSWSHRSECGAVANHRAATWALINIDGFFALSAIVTYGIICPACRRGFEFRPLVEAVSSDSDHPVWVNWDMWRTARIDPIWMAVGMKKFMTIQMYVVSRNKRYSAKIRSRRSGANLSSF